MYKRKRASSSYVNRPFKKPRRTYTAPRRTYPNSLVPLASRGYRPNSTELKVYDLPIATYQVSAVIGSITPICIPTLGTDMTNRIGRKILIKSFHIRGFVNSEITNNATATGNTLPQHVRMMIVWDTQPNGFPLTLAELLVSNDSGSQLNLNGRDRFKILCNKEWVLDPFHFSNAAGNSFCSSVNQIKLVKKYKKCNLEVVFNAVNGGTISDISTGALMMVWVGNAPAGANSDSNFVGTTRVRFQDK